jgi:coenzyme PQQ synthesis protein D (PqqD)
LKSELPSTTSAASSAAIRPFPAKHVLSAVHGTQTVLLDSRRGLYYSLDEVGGRIWTLLGEGCTPEAIVRQLAEEFAADPERIAHDVDDLLSTLRSKGMVEDVDSTTG